MVTQEPEPEAIAQQLGAGGVDNLVVNAERICGHEQQRIALTNQSRLASLEIEYNGELAEERRIEALLAGAPSTGSSLRLRLKAIFYWVVTSLFALSGLALTLYTFAPFRLGRVALIFAAGVAIVNPFLVDIALESRNILVRVLASVGAVASLASLMLLADVRANILEEQMRVNQEQAVVIDDAQPATQPENTFYERSNRSLHFALLLLAFGMEVAAGLALREAWRHVPDTSEDWKGLRRELAAIRLRKAQIVGVAVELRNQPGIFAARFWRDFYRAMLSNAVRSALSKVLLVPLALAVLAGSRAHAQLREDMVIAIDLTASVSFSGPDGKSEFQKNVEGVTRVLAQAPAGSRVTVIAITDHSFTQPYILLSAHISADPGYFGERLAAARNQLVRAWRLKSAHLEPDFHRTDIFGALELASQIFAEQPTSAKRTLIIFSDMRQNTPELDLETPTVAPSISAVAQRSEPMPALRGVHIEAFGVDGAGRSTAYWQGLRTFWSEYFRSTGADLIAYSSLRETPGSR